MTEWTEFFAQPLVVGLLLAIPATYLGYLGYKRSVRANHVSEKLVGVDQVYEGLLRIAELQKANDELRARLDRLAPLEEELRATIRRLDRLERFIQAQGWEVPE